MIQEILNVNGVILIKKDKQKSIHGGAFGCQNVARRCINDNDCCSGSCGVEKIINENLVTLSMCSFT